MKRKMLFFLLFVVTFLFSLSVGSYRIPFKGIIKVLIHTSHNRIYKTIVSDIRLPRLIFDCLVGSGLSVAGASYQSIFQNPLVSPDILGVANGAAFGAALGIILNFSLNVSEAFSFLFGILAVIITLVLARKRQVMPILGLVISGIVVGAFFTSLLGLAKYFADTENQLPQIVFWLLGSFSSVTWNAWPAMVLIGVCLVLVYMIRWQLNIASLRDDDAKSLGININFIRAIIIFLSTVMTAASVSIVGIVGWVGLVIPHISRLIEGSDNTKTIPMTILIGGIFLMLADDMARGVTTGEIPIGIITSFVGAPFFAYLYRVQKQL